MLSRFYKWLKNRTPGLPRRKDIEEEDPNLPAVAPVRKTILVMADKRRMNPLAQVRKGWGRKLKLLFSLYLANNINSEIKHRQALQACLHELMHIALWDIKTITHSTDEKSLIFALITGQNLCPTHWDLKVVREAAARIELIEIDCDIIANDEIMVVLEDAAKLWNGWIGKEFFTLL